MSLPTYSQVHDSYSADKISCGQSVRKPFEYDGELYCCISSGGGICTAYRMVPREEFTGVALTYGHSIRMAMREDPNGGYHRMAVTRHGKPYVLIGPPVDFVFKEGRLVEVTQEKPRPAKKKKPRPGWAGMLKQRDKSGV